MGIFDFFGKKEEPKSKVTKQEFTERFEQHVRELIEDEDDVTFFMLADKKGTCGKAIKGTPQNLEVLFGRLFKLHPETLGMIKNIISKYEKGEIKIGEVSGLLPMDSKTIEAAEKWVGKGNIDTTTGGLKRFSPNFKKLGDDEEGMKKFLEQLKNDIKSDSSKESEENNDDKSLDQTIREKMSKNADIFIKNMKNKKIEDIDTDDIIKRNLED